MEKREGKWGVSHVDMLLQRLKKAFPVRLTLRNTGTRARSEWHEREKGRVVAALISSVY